MKLYNIPRLYCPFESRIHPDREAIQEHTDQWVMDFELIDSIDTLEKYRAQKFGSMIARSYPYGEYADLAAWCDLNTLLFIVDDNLDEQDNIKDGDSFLKFVQGLLDVVERGRRCTIKKDGPVLAALDDFWQRMLYRSSDVWKQKFAQGIRDTFEGGLWQFNLVIKNERPDMDEYMKIRQYLGAANLATESLEVTGKVQLDEYVYRSPLVYKLTEIARNTVCFANDLFSLGKEIDQGTGNASDFNLVSIVSHKKRFTIDRAIEEVALIHNQYIGEFIRISKMASIFDDDTNVRLERYIDCLRHFMKGNIEWSTTESSRYPHIYAN
jgi:hypothetical protein